MLVMYSEAAPGRNFMALGTVTLDQCCPSELLGVKEIVWTRTVPYGTH